MDYLDKGFVKLISVYGDDATIENAARQSYDEGSTRKVSDSRALIRYLMRHDHMTPFEMCEVTFQLKLPIFVFNQLVRHRTANINATSHRYSEVHDQFYNPKVFFKQATENKQCSDKDAMLSNADNEIAAKLIKQSNNIAYANYKSLLELGVSRERARIVLPFSTYTTITWKCDLRNFMQFLRLRLHSHAQVEIRELAQLMYDSVSDKFPIAFEAFEDYILNEVKFNGVDSQILAFKDLGLSCENISKREMKEFDDKINKIRGIE